jgi:anti-anti-sigma regulatory factor
VRLTKRVAKRPHRRVLDLANVMFMDCAGITHMNQLRMIQDG